MKRIDRSPSVMRLSASLLLLFLLLTTVCRMNAVAASGPCSLTVLPVSETETETAEMLKKTKVLVDVYRVATASVNGGLRYALTDTFKGKVGVWVEDTSGGTATMVKINDFTDMTAGQKITEETYQKLAQDAAKQIQSGKVTQKVKTLSVGKEISGMSNKAEQMETGLYLLVARTDDKDYWWEVSEKDANGHATGKMNLASYVHNSQKGFLYLPTLVVLPSSSDSSDTWEYNVKAVLKPEIVKPTPTGKPTGFVGTGDDMKLWPFYTAAAVSGVIFLCLAGNAMVDLVRRKRSRK